MVYLQCLRKMPCWCCCSKSSLKIELNHLVLGLGLISPIISLKAKSIIIVLITATEVCVSIIKLLEDTIFFLNHVSIARKCYLVVRPGVPVLRLIFLDRRY